MFWGKFNKALCNDSRRGQTKEMWKHSLLGENKRWVLWNFGKRHNVVGEEQRPMHKATLFSMAKVSDLETDGFLMWTIWFGLKCNACNSSVYPVVLVLFLWVRVGPGRSNSRSILPGKYYPQDIHKGEVRGNSPSLPQLSCCNPFQSFCRRRKHGLTGPPARSSILWPKAPKTGHFLNHFLFVSCTEIG